MSINGRFIYIVFSFMVSIEFNLLFQTRDFRLEKYTLVHRSVTSSDDDGWFVYVVDSADG